MRGWDQTGHGEPTEAELLTESVQYALYIAL